MHNARALLDRKTMAGFAECLPFWDTLVSLFHVPPGFVQRPSPYLPQRLEYCQRRPFCQAIQNNSCIRPVGPYSGTCHFPNIFPLTASATHRLRHEASRFKISPAGVNFPFFPVRLPAGTPAFLPFHRVSRAEKHPFQYVSMNCALYDHVHGSAVDNMLDCALDPWYTPLHLIPAMSGTRYLHI
jgi:hypothetical protein